MAKGKFDVGAVVRQTSAFLRSIGMYKGVPVNGVVVDFVKGLNFPVVMWSDGHLSPINPVNLEIHKAGEAQMTPGLRASLVAEGKAKYAAKLAKEAAEEAAFWASPEGQAAKAKGGILRASLRGNPKKLVRPMRTRVYGTDQYGRKVDTSFGGSIGARMAQDHVDYENYDSGGKFDCGHLKLVPHRAASQLKAKGVRKAAFKRNPGSFTLAAAQALLDKQLTASLGKGWGSFTGETRHMPSGAWRIGVLYPKTGRWYWTIWSTGRLKGEHSLRGSRDPKKWTSGHKNPRKPGDLTAKGSEALLREAKKADRLADSVARELGEHHATTQAYRADAAGYRRRAGLRAKLRRKNPTIKLPSTGETLHIPAHGKTLGVKKVKAGEYTAGIEGTRTYVEGPSGKRWGNAAEIREDIEHFLRTGALPFSGATVR